MHISSAHVGSEPRNRRILLVDDDSDALGIFMLGLERAELEVDAYTSPLEALEFFKPNTYYIAVLDIRMPEMTGFQLHRRLRELDPAITTCFLSAFEIREDEFKKVFPSMQGVKAIIRKPVRTDELLKHIIRVI